MYQNGTQYELWLMRDDGLRLAVLDSVIDFDFTRIVNQPGNFRVSLTTRTPSTYLAYDRRILFWRKPVEGAMALEFVGVIRRLTSQTDDSGNITRTVSGPSITGWLGSRIIAYAAGTSYADKASAADDMMRAIVRENFGTSATDTARPFPASAFSVQNDVSLGPSLTKAFAYRNVLDVLREISDAARQAGTPVYFDLEQTGDGTTMEFRCYLNQRGRDRTTYGPVFGLDFGNLRRPSLDQDASGECNYAYGLGQGDGTLRSVQTATDSARTGRSLYGRWEDGQNAVIETSVAGVTAAAQSRVIAGRPVLTFQGELLSVPGAIYGKDWAFGDRITITYDGLQFAALVRGVSVQMGTDGREAITGLVEALL